MKFMYTGHVICLKDDGGPYFPEDGVAGELSAFQACFLLRWPQIADTDNESEYCM